MGTKGSEGPLARLAENYVKFLPLVVLLGLLSSILEGIGVGLLIPLVALLLSESVPSGIPWPFPQIIALADGYSAQTQITAVGGLMVGLIVCKGVLQACNTILIDWIYGNLGRDIRTALSARILRLNYRTFIEQDPVRLVHIISTDSWFASNSIRATLAMVPAAIGLAVFAALLAWLDWRLFIIVVVGAGLVRGVSFTVERKLERLSDKITQANYALADRMLGIVNDMRAIRVFGQEAREQVRFRSAAQEVHRAMFSSSRLSASLTPSVETLFFLLFVALLLAGHWLGMGIPEVSAFLVLLSRAQAPARTISRSKVEKSAVHGSVREVEWLLEQDGNERRVRENALPVPLGQPVRFDSVGFVYPGGNVALRDVSFCLKPGSATALIGRSGSGKSTLVNLLCGLLEPQTGSITVGDVPLDRIELADWLSHIAIAGQDVELVEGTVAENIAYGHPAATRQEIEEVARAAGADTFIKALPNGYETRTGQQGARLSGGQRQRIGIARALIRRPDLLILDEATNAVDAMSEQELLQLLREHRHFRSALVVSHRQSTLANCEEGIVIAGGRIVETGPLHDLDYYRKMSGKIA